MSAIARLALVVQEALSISVDFRGDDRVINREIEALRRMLGGTDPRDQPRADFLREAIGYFRTHRTLPNLGVARAVCYGVCDRFSENEPALLEDSPVFVSLLEGVDEYRRTPRHYRRCYRGLLHSYFKYDPERIATPIAGQGNWRKLRQYLEARLGGIKSDEESQPPWIDMIQEHANLLTASPTERYAADLLQGKDEVVVRIRGDLDIDDASWFMRKLILSQIERAAAYSDSDFQHLVPRLLTVLDGHPLLESPGLITILNRYADIRAPEPSARLRDRAVTAWGNPWLERSTARWAGVEPASKRLVENWLKKDIIRDFFEILSDERQTDRRRLRFWEAYHEQIDKMYFALGSGARKSTTADMLKIRERMGDHLLGLKGGGAANNAFIMMIGPIAAVEFGLTGNACYFYNRNDLPFELDDDLYVEKLKAQDSTLERLLHQDSGFGTWERRFGESLRTHGITAGEKPKIRAPSTRVDHSRFDRSDFQHFARLYRLEWTDNTDRGGNIWVNHPNGRGRIAEKLSAWSFQFNEARSQWWRNGWS